MSWKIYSEQVWRHLLKLDREVKLGLHWTSHWTRRASLVNRLGRLLSMMHTIQRQCNDYHGHYRFMPFQGLVEIGWIYASIQFSFESPLLPPWQLHLYCHSMTRTREPIFHEVQSVSRRSYDLQKNQTLIANKDLEKHLLQTCLNGHKYPHHANCLQKFTLNMSHKERFPYHSSFCTFFREKALFGNKYPKYFNCSFKKVCVFFIEKAKNEVYRLYPVSLLKMNPL